MEQPPDPPAHKRRVRYAGTHPRRFDEKYKERAPDQFPELIARVRERGQTPAGQHVPIMVDEVLQALAPKPGERGVDATLGFGGHAQRLLEALAPDGTLLGLDADTLELPKTVERLRALGFGENTLLARRTNFAGLRAALDQVGWQDGVDFLFADLGLSSMQIDDPARGFTFKFDGPLDMRINPRRGESAAQWLERVNLEELERVLVANADEPHASRIARVLDDRRGGLTTTLKLANAVRDVLHRAAEDEVELSVRRVFQAVRIEINDEFGALDGLLRQLRGSLRPGARVAFLTFHSGEDGRVKKSFERGLSDGFFAEIADEPLRASPEERRDNPRAKSAKLRWARRE